MKTIPFRRKLKHFAKNAQRDNALGRTDSDAKKEFRNFFINLGVYVHNRVTPSVLLRLPLDKCKRFYKLCKRLGKAAKKKNSIIDGHTLLNMVEWGFIFDSNSGSSDKIHDPRKIPFLKFFKVDVVQSHSVYVLDTSEENVLKNRKSFDGRVYFKGWEIQTQKNTSLNVKELTKSILDVPELS